MNKNNSLHEIVALVLRQPHINVIRLDGNWEMKNINYSLWTEKRDLQIQDMFNYLNSPYIIDDFETDHTSRREWKSTRGEDYNIWKEFYKSNCLRRNSIATMSLVVSLLEEGYVGTNPDEYEKFKNDIKNHFEELDNDGYNNNTTEEKIKLVHGLKKKIFNFLEFLSEQKPADI